MSDHEKNNRQARLERLRAVLAAYGAERSRWPEADRTEFADADMTERTVASDVGEARALDALLAHASSAAPAHGAASGLAARIVATDGEDRVVNLGHRHAGPVRPATRMAASYWPAAGLLAASLVIGVFLGQSDIWPDAIGGSFLTADAGIDDLGSLFLGLPLDPASLVEDTL